MELGTVPQPGEVLNGFGPTETEFPPSYSWFEHMDVSSQLIPMVNLLAAANPLDTKVDAISDVVEGTLALPFHILKRAGTALQSVANANLSLTFGLYPALQDIITLLNMSDLIDQRVKDLQTMGVTGMFTSKTKFDRASDTEVINEDITIQLGPANWHLTYLGVKRTQLTRWGVVCYDVEPEAAALLNQLNFDQLREYARNSLLGLQDISPASIWEIIPFSWLIDWFIPVQKILEVYGNQLPVKPSKALVMTKRVTDIVVQCIDADETSFGGWDIDLNALRLEGTRTTLERQIVTDPLALPDISVNRKIPLLSPRQAGILASLVAQRSKLGALRF
nr:MAG: putative maturation protein [Leviviridae sp.]